jgi:hypothetical protein
MIICEAAQRSEEWFAARRGIPTCSRFDSIITPGKGEPAKAQETLINELIAESICPPDQGFIRPTFISPEMEYGMKLEAEARCSFELEYAGGQPVREVGFALHESGLFGGSPDALVGEMSGVEIKCPNASTHVGYIRAGVLPQTYKAQVHGYLAVTGRSHWWFFSYARNFPPFCIRVGRDDFTAKLEAELYAFAERYNVERKKFGLPPLGKL